MTKRSLLLLTLASALAACSSGRAQDRGAGQVDLTTVMQLQSAGGCRFDALTNHAFEGLLMVDSFGPFEMTHAPEVAIGDLRLRPQMTRESNPNYPGGLYFRSAVSFPTRSRWNGLTPLEMWSDYSHNPEIDHAEARGITFAESPARVREALLAIGADVPVTPGYRELDDRGPYSGGCSANIEISPDPRGAALICSYGC